MVTKNKEQVKEAVNKQAAATLADESGGASAVGVGSSGGVSAASVATLGKRHSLRTDADAAALARGRVVAEAAGVTTSGTGILLNICRALLVRALFVVHSLIAIWAAVNVRADNSIWTFALLSLSIVVEG